MRRSYGYGSYRGRGGFRTFLKVVIGLLTVVLVLLVAGYFLLQQFAVVTDEGIRFDIPFFQHKDPPPPPSDPIVVETPNIIITPSPTPEPEPVEEPIHVVALSRTALTDGTAEEQVTAAGGSAALFDMKADDGSLGYVSQLQLAKTLRASAADATLNTAIETLNDGTLYTVARVSCFKDNFGPYRNNNLSLKTTSGYNWKDADGVRWLGPAVPEVRKYLADICVELAQLGFDEILLDNAGYPAAGRLESIRRDGNYEEGNLSPVVTGFYEEVKTALAGYPDVKLSIVAAEATLDGTDVLSGQTVETLVSHAARIWSAPPVKDIADYTALLTAAGMEDLNANLVYYSTQAGGAENSWAIWK